MEPVVPKASMEPLPQWGRVSARDRAPPNAGRAAPRGKASRAPPVPMAAPSEACVATPASARGARREAAQAARGALVQLEGAAQPSGG